MGDSDAEWVGVDFEFGKADPPPPRTTTTTTQRPGRPRPPRPTFTEKPLPVPRPGAPDAPEREGPPKNPVNSNSATVVSCVIGGIFGVVLLSLVVYMLVLRRRLNKAKVASTDSQYQLRVEDVAHLTHLDETSNTYVNTTDLQKLLTSVKAKNKAQEKPPPPLPKIQHQTPTPYRSAPSNNSNETPESSDNNGYASDPDVVVLRAPMPLPHKTGLLETSQLENNWTSKSSPSTEALYSNVEPVEPFKLSKPPSRKKLEAPTAAPPPPPTIQREKSSASIDLHTSEPKSPTVIARPAPPPPKLVKTKSCESIDIIDSNSSPMPRISKPTPPVAPKPNKNGQSAVNESKSTDSIPALLNSSKPMPPSSKPNPPVTSKPAPPVMSKPSPPVISKPAPPVASKPTPPVVKPSVIQKGKGLPPLKMALIPKYNKTSIDSCTTPDTGIIELTPENTPTPDTGSISSKIALLEGKMKTPILPTRAKPY